MKYTRQQTQEAFKKLSPGVQSFVMDNEMEFEIEELLINNGFNENQIDDAEMQTHYLFIGLQNIDTTINEIGVISRKDRTSLKNIEMELSKILLKIKQMDLPPKEYWMKILEEITQKYSLSNEQRDELELVVDKITEDLENKDEILKQVEINLEISNILSDQIISEINSRIIDRNSNLNNTSPKILDKTIPQTAVEVRPDILPEKTTGLQNDILDRQKTNEISTPRYDQTVNKPSSGGIIEKKLNTVISSNSNPLKYEKDPYRESIE